MKLITESRIGDNVNRTLATFIFLSCVSLACPAQEYPLKPIRVVVPFPPAGTVDLVARTLSQGLSEAFRQPVTVENRVGANGNLGPEQVSKAPPDGYTLLVNGIPHAINATLYEGSLPFDTVKDFSPIILAAATPLVLVVTPSLQARNLAEIISLARAKPGDLNYGSAGNGTMQHLAMEILKLETGINVVHVPFKGSPPAMIALMSGTVSIMISDMPTAIPQIRAGKIRALATTAASEVVFAPGVLPFAAQGFPKLDMKLWIGAFAPARTPPELVRRLNAEMAKTLADPQVRKRLASVSIEPLGGTPQEFDAYLKSEIERWGKVIREGGVRAD